MGILGELIEKERQKSVDVLACGDSVADGTSTV